MRRCRTCGEHKPDIDFQGCKTRCIKCLFHQVDVPEGKRQCSSCKEVFPLEHFHKNGNGRRSVCPACDHGRKFKLTRAEYDDYFGRAAYRCEVCGTRPASRSDLHLDHCHASGKVRGVLCRSCNLALGYTNDNPITLEKLIAYLKARGA